MNTPDDGFQVRSLMASVYLPSFLFSVGMGAVIPILPLLGLELGLSASLAGTIVVMRSLGTLVFDAPAGLAVARLGEHRAMLIGSAVLAVVATGISMRPSAGGLMALVVLMGAAWSVWLLARLAYAATVAPPHMRGRVMSMLGGSNRIGTLVGPLIGSVLVSMFGLVSVFYLQAVFSLIALVALLLSPLKNTRTSSDTGRWVGRQSAGRGVQNHLRRNRKVILVVAVSSLSIQILRSARDVILPLWGHDIGLTASQVSLLFGMAAAVETLVFYPAGVVSDRYGRKWTAIPCLLALSVGLGLVPLVAGFAGMAAIALIVGIGNGMGTGIQMTMGSDLAPRAYRAEFLGLWRMIGDGGAVGGPSLVVLVSSLAGLGFASVVVAGVGIVGAVLMSVLVPKPLTVDDP